MITPVAGISRQRSHVHPDTAIYDERHALGCPNCSSQVVKNKIAQVEPFFRLLRPVHAVVSVLRPEATSQPMTVTYFFFVALIWSFTCWPSPNVSHCRSLEAASGGSGISGEVPWNGTLLRTAGDRSPYALCNDHH